jgi:hypothetical protein
MVHLIQIFYMNSKINILELKTSNDKINYKK